MTTDDRAQDGGAGAIIVGLVIIFIGITLLADRVGISGIHLTGRMWPFVLIAFGVSRLLATQERQNGQPRSRWTGVWFIYLGLWFFANEFRVMGLWYNTSWPLLLVGAGIGIVWRALERTDGRERQRIEDGR
jgi:hypothetical protein